MAADYYIHIADESLLEEDKIFRNFDEVLKYFKHNVIGSKYYNPALSREDPDFRMKEQKAWEIVENTPAVYIGEVSWMAERVPPTIAEIDSLFPEDGLAIIDDEFIQKVRAAFDLPNPTGLNLANPEAVVKMLERYKGMYAFSATW